MVGRNLVNLGSCVLLFLGAQIERAYTPNIDASRSVRNTPEFSPVASVNIGSSSPERTFISEARKNLLRDFISTRLSVPTKFIAWSNNVKSFMDMPSAQQNCLTTAVYFESRSESALGQLAVALVVLNRTQASNSSVCGVVYKGANRINACQFSFACDGKLDVVDDIRAWKLT